MPIKGLSTKRLSDQEFATALQKLHARGKSDQKGSNSPDEADFQLMIDYRLGTDFPNERRRAMFAIHRVMCDERNTLVAQFASGQLPADAYSSALQSLIKKTAEAYANILSPLELDAFAGKSAGQPPLLPLDPEKLVSPHC